MRLDFLCYYLNCLKNKICVELYANCIKNTTNLKQDGFGNYICGNPFELDATFAQKEYADQKGFMINELNYAAARDIVDFCKERYGLNLSEI